MTAKIDKDEIRRLKEHIRHVENMVKAAITHISFASGINCVDKGIDALRRISK